MKLGRRIVFMVSMALAACGGDDDGGDGPVIDAPAAEIDAAGLCVLPEGAIDCNLGDDSPCTAECSDAFCADFLHLPGPVCTSNCTPGDTSCPISWTCTNMGQCSPP